MMRRQAHITALCFSVLGLAGASCGSVEQDDSSTHVAEKKDALPGRHLANGGISEVCLQNVFCKLDHHWDHVACRCVPNVVPDCVVDSDCHGILPHYCRVCDNGTPECAHWQCHQGACRVSVCD
jgi:hypothetical protein